MSYKNNMYTYIPNIKKTTKGFICQQSPYWRLVRWSTLLSDSKLEMSVMCIFLNLWLWDKLPVVMASISRRSSNKVSITIFQMLLAGRRTHKNKSFFMGSTPFEGVFMGLDYGKSIYYRFGLWAAKMLWIRIMGVKLVGAFYLTSNLFIVKAVYIVYNWLC
jgi:hypothetical protein